MSESWITSRTTLPGAVSHHCQGTGICAVFTTRVQ